MADTQATIILGDAANMSCIGAGEARLVVTSPPYFSDELASVLSGRRRKQLDIAGTWSRVESYARALDGAFRDIARIVGVTGLCCIETKDLAFGEFRLPLAALHAQQAREAGLWVRSSFLFRSTGIKPSHLPEFFQVPSVGNFRTLDSSTMLVCSHPAWQQQHGQPLDLERRVRLELIAPLWKLTPARVDRTHVHQSPPVLVRRLIELLSSPGDLVVDPFAGSGQAIRIARKIGRNAIGYESDPVRHAAAIAALVSAGVARAGIRATARGKSRT